MKKALRFLIIVSLILTLAGCGKTDTDNICGKWRINSDSESEKGYLEFFKEGNFIAYDYDNNFLLEGRWSLRESSKRGTLIDGDDPLFSSTTEFTYEFKDKNTLYMLADNNSEMYLYRD